MTKSRLKGMWVSVPTEWDEHDDFDERTFRDEIAMLIDTGAHGLKQVTDAFLAETAGKVPVQIGADWFNTPDTIRRVRYAGGKRAGGVQVCFPGWMQMRDDDYDQFLADVYEAGRLPGARRTRRPYQPLSDGHFAPLKQLTGELLPEFLSCRR